MHAVDSVGMEASGGISFDGKIAGLYDLEETLGSGHFAVVKLARHVFTGAKVAVKVVDKTKLDEVSKAHLFQEVRCMKLVQHPNVVRLYEVIDTQTKLYLVLELGDGGDLYDYIMKHDRGLDEESARKYFRQIVRAISYCHQLHVVHRDLKPENVVFFEKLGVVKLTDFGFSNKFSPGQKLETSCGSLAYSAPEILLGDSYDAPAVDIWSLGVILYMIVCGQPPFEKANDSETLTMIMDCKYTVPPFISTECRNLIGTMLVRDPEKRASLEQIAKHPWLKQSGTKGIIDYLPLVSRQELSEEDHAFIIQKMINGKIASKDEILKSLDKNQYNHITATYFLLGELRLRKRREEQLKKQCPLQSVSCSSSKRQNACPRALDADKRLLPNENTKLVVPINIEICQQNLVAETTQDKRIRKCSIVREEDEDESVGDCGGDKYELKVTATRRESISDGRLSQSVQERANCIVPMVVPVNPNSKMTVSVDVTLAEKLNQIEKNRDTVIMPAIHSSSDDTFRVSTATSINEAICGIKGLKINKLKHLAATSKNPVLTHRKTKLNKIRTPSCSSSEASDDDTKSRSKKKINKFVGDTPTRFRMHRRDSHDDSSDSQDQTTCPSTGAHYSARNFCNSNSSNSSGKKTEQQQHNKEKSKPEDTRKSSHSHSKQKKNLREQQKQTQANKPSFAINIHRRHIRESQSLDRITEAQEYEQRYRNAPICNLISPDTEIQQSYSLYNLNSLSVAEVKEEYDEELNINDEETQATLKSGSKDTMEIKRNTNHISKLNSIDEIDVVIYVNSLTKVIQVAGSKCSVTMKKIRRLGKYFSVVNYS